MLKVIKTLFGLILQSLFSKKKKNFLKLRLFYVIYFFFTSTLLAGHIFKLVQNCLGETALTEFSIIFDKYLLIITSQSFLYAATGKREQIASKVSLTSVWK